ncbi:type VI secretion system baseplate subunit TssF [Veronia pacifica]|uniref:Type VI secretion protein n=1 Tax=Veronia pacifica TaxID=1080227 RepID=A0A1C3EDN7_9GAMM|nr:type VI secretion system baseplate subunit TssF [Veronia pacifica]ODA31366.1 type VI secretion protein [Veronia pacifica]
MSDSLLPYFEQELHFIRSEAQQFAKNHPGAANSLGLSRDSIVDPQLAWLMESVALLNGRLQRRLDSAFPELSESLLNLLFPHYLRPVPSYSMLDFQVQEKTNSSHVIPAGTEFDIDDHNGNAAIFRTTDALSILPLRVIDLNVSHAPFADGKPQGAERATVRIEITIGCTDEGADLSTLNIEQLQLHPTGDSNLTLRICDLLMHASTLVCVSVQGQSHPLSRDHISVPGFDGGATVLPYQASSFGGLTLLTEFFQFPERFKSVSLQLGEWLNKAKGSTFALHIYIDELAVDLARNLSAEHFSLFVTPVVNLYRQVADPVRIDFMQNSYPLTFDNVQGSGHSVFSVDHVADISEHPHQTVPQVYAEKYGQQETGLRWQLCQTLRENDEVESHLKVADLAQTSVDSDPRTWLVDITVTEGEQAARLSPDSQVSCRDTLTIPADVGLLRRPTMPVRQSEKSKHVVALLHHLHFNFHAILGADDPLMALKQMLSLYNLGQCSQNQLYIDALSAMTTEQVVAPIRVSGRTCFASGTKITVTLDVSHMDGGRVLFSRFLDRFFSHFAGFNSFTQLDVYLDGEESMYLKFPRRSGCKQVV